MIHADLIAKMLKKIIIFHGCTQTSSYAALFMVLFVCFSLKRHFLFIVDFNAPCLRGCDNRSLYKCLMTWCCRNCWLWLCRAVCACQRVWSRKVGLVVGINRSVSEGFTLVADQIPSQNRVIPKPPTERRPEGHSHTHRYTKFILWPFSVWYCVWFLSSIWMLLLQYNKTAVRKLKS